MDLALFRRGAFILMALFKVMHRIECNIILRARLYEINAIQLEVELLLEIRIM